MHQDGAESIVKRQLRFLDYRTYQAYHINFILLIQKGMKRIERKQLLQLKLREITCQQIISI